MEKFDFKILTKTPRMNLQETSEFSLKVSIFILLS